MKNYNELYKTKPMIKKKTKDNKNSFFPEII
jgi:hypothetical protein